MGSDQSAVVVKSDGLSESLGAFLRGAFKSAGQPISQVSRTSGLSRSFLYLLMDDEQVPSTESLVTLLDAAGCEDVRPADPGDPGDLAFRWRGEELWVRFPTTSWRSARSRRTMQSLNRGSDSVSSPPPMRGMAEMSSSAASYDADGGWSRSPAGDRQLLLGQLLDAAGALDEERLALLVEHARILRRG